MPWTIAGKRVLVTGATNGLGLATATELARRGAQVIGIARNLERARAGREAVAAGGGGDVEMLTCDLADMSAIRELATTVIEQHGQLDVLINNAAVAMFTRELTEDGLETSFAVNHIAPFLLTNLLLPALLVPGEARVLTVSSDNHKRIKQVPWDDLQGEQNFKPLLAYDRTKLMNVWFTQILSERLRMTAVTANAVSPGFVRTDLARHAQGGFSFFIHYIAPLFQSSPEKGAETSVWAASSADLSAVTGAYLSGGKIAEAGGLAGDHEAAERLWTLSEKLTGYTAPIG